MKRDQLRRSLLSTSRTRAVREIKSIPRDRSPPPSILSSLLRGKASKDLGNLSSLSLSDSISSIILDCYDRELELVRGEEPDGKFKTSVHKQWPRHARVHDSLDAWLPFSRQPDTKWPGWLGDDPAAVPSTLQNLIRSISRSILLLFLNFNTFVVILFSCKETVVYIIVFNEVKLF